MCAAWPAAPCIPPKWKIEAASTADSVAVANTVDHVVEIADAPRGDHRDRHGVGDRAGERDVEADLGAVAVHRGEKDLAGAERRDLAGAGDGSNT